MKLILLPFIFIASNFVSLGQSHDFKFYTDMEVAKAEAVQHNKDLLVVFAGSDWCKPCIQFKRSILVDSSFQTYAKKHLNVVYLDFPAKKKNALSPEQVKHNEALAEKYNREGVFPRILLMTSEEKIIQEIPFRLQSASSFIKQCTDLSTGKKNSGSGQFHSAKKKLILMGCAFEVSAVGPDESIVWEAINTGISEIQRIEKLISSWDQNSETSKINAQAGIAPVIVDRELFDLIYRAKKISRLTEGSFDISFASMNPIWKFDKTEHELPSEEIVAKAHALIDWNKIVLNDSETSVFLSEKGMKIGFGAIGKGYAANQAKAVMQQIPDLMGGLVNASGDLTAWGVAPNNDAWTIQISDPVDKTKTLAWIALEEMAIVTSGNYEKYFTSNGVRYAHIINPKTGYPTTKIKSASVVCPNAEVADALSTSLFVLGKEQGLALINKLEHIECLIITDDNKIHTSNNLKLNYL